MSVRYPCVHYEDLSYYERRRSWITQRLIDLDRSLYYGRDYSLYVDNLVRELDSLYYPSGYPHCYCYRSPYCSRSSYYLDHQYELNKAWDNNRRLERELALLKSQDSEGLVRKNRDLEDQLYRKSRELEDLRITMDSSQELVKLQRAYDDLNEQYNTDVKKLHEQYNKLNSTHLELLDAYKTDKSELQDKVKLLSDEVDNQIEINKFRQEEPKQSPIKKRRASTRVTRGRITDKKTGYCETCVNVHKHEWAKIK